MGAAFLVFKASKLHGDNLPDDTTAVVLGIKEVDSRLKLKQSDLIVQPYYKAQETINGYTLLKPLIQNERTWLCEKRGLQYVIKFAPYEVADDETLLDLFVKEVWMAKRLKAGFFQKQPFQKTVRSAIIL